MNITQNLHIRQEKSKTKLPPIWLQYFVQLLNEFNRTKKIEYLLDAIKRCPRTVKRIFALLLKMDNIYTIVNPAQQWLAHAVGSTCRSYISEIINCLVCCGVLRVKQRGWVPAVYKKGVCVQDGHWLSNIYTFTPLMYTRDCRYRIAGILPGCQALEYSLLMVFEKDIQSDNQKKPTLLRPSSVYKNSKPYFNYKPYDTVRSTYYEEGRTICKRGIKMAQFDYLLPTQLLQLKSMQLSNYGRALLCQYPNEALAYADAAIVESKDLINPFKRFKYLCDRFCKINNITLNVSLAQRILADFSHELEDYIYKKNKEKVQSNYPSSHIETKNKPFKEEYQNPAPSRKPMTTDEWYDNKKRLDNICAERLRESKIKTWKNLYERGMMNMDLLQRLLISVECYDTE